MAQPLKILDLIFSPISIPMRSISLLINELLGKQKSNFNINYLSQAYELTSKTSTTKEEQKILKGIVSFGNTETKQVMRPRIDIFALQKSTNFPTVISEIVKNGYSRIPVFENSIDSINGILYAKDLLPHLRKKSFDWTKLIRKPFFVPENKKLDDLMKEFKTKKEANEYAKQNHDELMASSNVEEVEVSVEEEGMDLKEDSEGVKSYPTEKDNIDMMELGDSSIIKLFVKGLMGR